MVVIGNSPDGGRLAKRLGCDHIAILQSTYPDGETSLKLSAKVSDTDCVVYFQFQLGEHFGTQLMNLIALMRYLKHQEASIKLVLPYLPYARSIVLESELEISKLDAMLDSIGQFASDLYVLQPHCEVEEIEQRVGATRVHEISIEGTLIAFLNQKLKDFVLTGPDKGSADMIKGLAHLSGKPFLILEKKRLAPNAVASRGTRKPIPQGLLTKPFMIVDDISSTGGTLLATIDRLRDYGVRKIAAFVFHNLIQDARVWHALQQREVNLFFSNSLPSEHAAIDIIDDVARTVRPEVSVRAGARLQQQLRVHHAPQQ